MFTGIVEELGSIAVNGCCLTIAELDDDGFAVAIIPQTLAVTTLGQRPVDDHVNLEIDLGAKYVERLSSVSSEGIV